MPQPAPRRVALFGGTFDPIHHGHLAAARAAVQSGIVSEVRFVVAGDPPHKPAGPHAPKESRYCMAVLATLDEPAFRVERWELDRPGPSYAVDTMREAKRALAAPDGSPVELVWIIGTDAIALIHTWQEPLALFGLATFLVIARAGFDELSLREHLAKVAPWAPAAGMAFLPMPLVNLSSTDLRAHIARGESLPEAVPVPVATYIGRYGLYQPTSEVAR